MWLARPSWIADVSLKQNPARQPSLAVPRPLGQAKAIQDHVNPSRDRKRKLLLNHPPVAHCAVTSVPAVDYDMLPLHPLLWVLVEFGISHPVAGRFEHSLIWEDKE